LWRWEHRGRGRRVNPPHIVKERHVKASQKRYGARVFVETGTYYGDMVAPVKGIFREIYSIELSKSLAEKARRRFRRHAHIRILCGDSATLLADVLASIVEPSVFWLDGHYSGGETARGACDYPVLAELQAIQHHPVKAHVVLIDDARSFTGAPGIPALAEILEPLRQINPRYAIDIVDDIIRALPPKRRSALAAEGI